MNFKQYLAESEQTFNYRVKTVAVVNKTVFNTITNYFQRFNLIKISTVRKTPLQKAPLDFASVNDREVFILDVTIGLPISSFILQRELVGILGLPGDYIVVRGENDPIEVQNDITNQTADIVAQAEKKGLKKDTLLGIVGEYPEAEQTCDGSNYYGDSYNSRLLAYVKTMADEREAKNKVEAKMPLFSWLEDPKKAKEKKATPEDDFNFYHGPDLKYPDTNAKTVSRTGNFDDEGVIVKKTYKSNKVVGKTTTTTLAGKPTSIRKKD